VRKTPPSADGRVALPVVVVVVVGELDRTVRLPVYLSVRRDWLTSVTRPNETHELEEDVASTLSCTDIEHSEKIVVVRCWPVLVCQSVDVDVAHVTRAIRRRC
jgi:hypothetical protein